MTTPRLAMVSKCGLGFFIKVQLKQQTTQCTKSQGRLF